MSAGDGEVVSLAARAGYRPNLGALARGHVATARARTGLSLAAFAARLGPLLGWDTDGPTVRRWETTTTPPTDVTFAAMLLAQDAPGDVLSVPLSADAAPRAAVMSAIGSALELAGGVRPYGDRAMVSRAEWNDIITGSADRLWLYGMAEFGYASDPAVPGILAEAAAAGADVRVLLLSPSYAGIPQIESDEGSPPGTLAARITASLHRFGEMQRAEPGIRIRTYDAHPTLSVVRGDGEMLVTPYLRFFSGSASPTWRLDATTGGRMFARYERHFIDAWDRAAEGAAA
jgi:hypothetical protein